MHVVFILKYYIHVHAKDNTRNVQKKQIILLLRWQF